jgi:hypothetical protein
MVRLRELANEYALEFAWSNLQNLLGRDVYFDEDVSRGSDHPVPAVCRATAAGRQPGGDDPAEGPGRPRRIADGQGALCVLHRPERQSRPKTSKRGWRNWNEPREHTRPRLNEILCPIRDSVSE